jgi:hypothetical protein
MMIRKFHKKWLTVAVFVALMSMMFAFEVSADDIKQPGALTTPPPTQAEVKITTLNTSFNYLYDALLTISDLGNLKVRLLVTTTAYEIVSSIGADVSIQRWTGTQWVNVHNTILSTTSNDNYNSKVDWNVTAGYYYRGLGKHWIKKGSIKEELVVYSTSILIAK